ncbi:MAG TPA: hypothetical protein EYP59_21535 [Thiotrichaceae bacterium]|nr:hypothetical protein [Thiotrichaceae bacterium]
MSDLSNFFVKKVILNRVNVNNDTVSFQYLLDGGPLNLKLHYNSVNFDHPKLNANEEAVKTFAVTLGVAGFLRFGAVLPEYFDIKKYHSWVHPALLKFLKEVFPHWSEHRYQVGRLDYRATKILPSDKLGESVQLPIWQQNGQFHPKVMVASGSGKDSLLCATLIEKANVDYDFVTYIHNLYGETTEQYYIFDRLSQHLNFQNHHLITIDDDYYLWLETRLKEYQVREYLQEQGITKPFRTEAGEVLCNPLMFAPIQIVHDLELAIVGHEKSADAPNFIIPETGEKIAHQWAKSIEGENAVHRLLNNLFKNIGCVSITKPIYDVSIFKLLFQITGELPYLTNSCNIKKPWCCECEKCAYVFAGFTAFGNHKRTIEAFGDDLFQREKLLQTWRELLGLEGYIPWECVGQAEEVQLYFYKAYHAGVTGTAINLFCEEILSKINGDPEVYFNNIEHKYSQVDCEHHLPIWLLEKVMPILHGKRS